MPQDEAVEGLEAKAFPDALAFLQQWYADQCNGDWEHSYGVSLDTLDNPGWILKAELKDTLFADLRLAYALVRRSKHDWYGCCIEDCVFIGAGGPFNLGDILAPFQKLIQDSGIRMTDEDIEERRDGWSLVG